MLVARASGCREPICMRPTIDEFEPFVQHLFASLEGSEQVLDGQVRSSPASSGTPILQASLRPLRIHSALVYAGHAG